MSILVTGSAGHLGEALMRMLRAASREAVGIDLKPSPFTQHTGDIADRAFVRAAMRGISAVIHTATLHKPHVATHPAQDFVDTNISGTLALLEEAVAAGVLSFVFTSTTSVFRGADASRGRAGRMDHRRRNAGTEEYLRHHQARRRTAMRAVPPAPRPAGAGAAHLALLPRGG